MKVFEKSASSKVKGPLAAGLHLFLLIFIIVFVAFPDVQQFLLSALYPGEDSFLHSRVSLLEMTGTHLVLTLAATALSVFIGLVLGVVVTRSWGRDFQAILQKINAFIQTFPPSAVIILAFPFLGFGWEPTLFALFLYSLFPVVGNTIVGFSSISPAIIDAATGMGMTETQRLFMVEFPQARSFILTGIRHAYILNLGTASIGAVIGAGGLGTIIMSGLTLRNSALVLSGTLVIVSLALLGEYLFNLLVSEGTRG